MRNRPPGTSFETALNAAYLGGQWRVVSGAGKGNQVTFSADGQVVSKLCAASRPDNRRMEVPELPR